MLLFPAVDGEVFVDIERVVVCKVRLRVYVGPLSADTRRRRLTPQRPRHPARYVLHQHLLVVAILTQLTQQSEQMHTGRTSRYDSPAASSIFVCTAKRTIFKEVVGQTVPSVCACVW